MKIYLSCVQILDSIFNTKSLTAHVTFNTYPSNVSKYFQTKKIYPFDFYCYLWIALIRKEGENSQKQKNFIDFLTS